ncbi:acyl-CoA dehydrogenase family member 11 [Octopus bimaculoides]|uniref:Acyl-CoA dehydrogenase/oxidase C-terminal domain-containing protein n=1 Tax=Octopus bimaculoides TaxID=37653 RepID=A0A0L8FXD9_OCTBM|nr:acyl-CoA dehydrogenase family member 11 [Octopus bimaculoides]|eukprot:XP_014786027.1 PREDICTED: acyl-CoA dehydrogenase family member 11-like isoform X1 [Octopus bimaculoides]
MFKRIPFYVIFRLNERCQSTRLKELLNCFKTNTFINKNGNFQVCSTDATVQPPTNFIQQQPILSNQYLKDPLLRSFLKLEVPSSILSEFEEDLIKFGDKVEQEIYAIHLQCDRQQPTLISYDAWGKRVDVIETSSAWKKMHAISATEGFISIPYERKYKEYSRLYQVVKLILFSSASGLYSCPLAMTDGAAKITEELKLEEDWLKKGVFGKLTSRNPLKFWTSGQWMTERRGGSDVAASTETIAKKDKDGFYRLYGNKWFTSATDANMAFTLARVVQENGQTISGKNGLAMFYVAVKDEDGQLNNIEIVNLKNKLGTRQMPTAELQLNGTKAFKVSPTDKGISYIATMLTITRIHNAISAVSYMRRIVNMACQFATERQAFKHLLKDFPLHVKTLAKLEMETRGATILVLHLGHLLGLQENKKSSPLQDNLLRLLTPITKLYTGKQAVAVVSEGLECFGGQGYIEDTGIPTMLRDSQVLPIWEGTTNILSLDVLRALHSSKEILESFGNNVRMLVSSASQHELLNTASCNVVKAMDETMQMMISNKDVLASAARDLAFSFARIYISALLLRHATSPESTPSDVKTALYWSEMELTPFCNGIKKGAYHSDNLTSEFDLVFGKHT